MNGHEQDMTGHDTTIDDDDDEAVVTKYQTRTLLVSSPLLYVLLLALHSWLEDKDVFVYICMLLTRERSCSTVLHDPTHVTAPRRNESSIALPSRAEILLPTS